MNFRHIQSNWRNELLDSMKGAQVIRIICPFIKLGPISALIGIDQGNSIQVITRLKAEDFCSGVSDIEALQWLLEQGAEVKVVENLHSKVYIFDESKAIVTSANLTDKALDSNFEFGISLETEETVKGSLHYFNKLWEQHSFAITADILQEYQGFCDEKRAQLAVTKDSGFGEFDRKIRKAIKPSKQERTSEERITKHLNKVPQSLRTHFLNLNRRICQLDRVRLWGVEQMMVQRIKDKSKPFNFTEVVPKVETEEFEIRLRNDVTYKDPESWIADQPRGETPLDRYFIFNAHSDITYAYELIKASYEQVLRS